MTTVGNLKFCVLATQRHFHCFASISKPASARSIHLCSRLNVANTCLGRERVLDTPTHANVSYCVRRVYSSRKAPHAKPGRRTADQTVERTPVINPLDDLQKFVSIPIIPEADRVFRPTEEEIIQAHNLFHPTVKHPIVFLKSALYDEHLPDYDLPEVAFIGRSNVGKSTLIKALLQEADEEVRVRCSKTPGHTKLMNFFQVGKCFTLVDMPGYGYNMPEHYVDSVENFLKTRNNLMVTFLLFDAKSELNVATDEHLARILDMNVNICIVLTKIDKARPSIIIKQLMKTLDHMKTMQRCLPQPFLVSSTKGDGIALLQAFIAYAAGKLEVKEVG